MSITDARSEAGVAMNRLRWGDRVAVRSAHIVIERRDELPASLRAEVIGALTEQNTEADHG